MEMILFPVGKREIQEEKQHEWRYLKHRRSRNHNQQAQPSASKETLSCLAPQSTMREREKQPKGTEVSQEAE